MTNLLSAPSKKGFEIKSFDKTLLSYVKETYGDEQANSHGTAFTDFANLRNKMLSKLFDKHESALNILTQYYDQFVSLENKIPMEENSVRIDFKWEDAFCKESLFGKKNSLKIYSGSYERYCLLYNIAALQSQIAESQNLSDDGGLKTAAKYNQQAAGIFSYLKNVAPNITQRETALDLNPDTLCSLGAIMLSQAQELIYIKASRDQMKDAMIAKVVQQLSDLYSDALKLMQLNSVKSLWPKEWIPLVAGKQAGYHAMAEYHQAKACGSNQSYGEQIARLKKSLELMKTASSRGGAKFTFKTEMDRIKRDLESAEKENNLIYHDMIPDVGSLSPVGKVSIAKEMPIDNPMSKNFRDAFAKIVPLELHSAMICFENKRKNMLQTEIFRLKEATENLNGIMATFNLPASVEDCQGNDIPETLLKKAIEIRQEGGIDKLETMINALPDLASRNSDILKEAVNMLDEEEESDKKLREQFKERWSRTPSLKLTENWRKESNKFSGLLEQAYTADETIRGNFNQHQSNIRLLSQNEDKLKANIPKSNAPQSASSGSDNLKQELKKLCKEAEDIKSVRNEFITEVQNTDYSAMSNEFTKALAEDSALNKEEFADQQINKSLQTLRERVRESLNQQSQLLAEIESKATAYSSAHGGGPGNDRASIISGLTVSAEKFEELRDHLFESQKFYGDLTDLFLKFQNKVKDFCFARKTEKDELMKDLQSSITRERTEHSTTNTSAPTASNNYQATSPGTTDANQSAPPRPNQTYATPSQPAPYQYPGGNAPVPAMNSAPNYAPPYPPNPYNMPQPSYMPGTVPNNMYGSNPMYMPGAPYPYNPAGQHPQTYYPPNAGAGGYAPQYYPPAPGSGAPPHNPYGAAPNSYNPYYQR